MAWGRVWASCFRLSTNCALASSADSPATFSKRRICSSWCFSSSVRLILTTSICLFRFSLMASFSFNCLSRLDSFWLMLCSFCLIRFSDSLIFCVRCNTSRSWSALSCTNFSLVSSNFSFFRFSAFVWPSAMIFCASCSASCILFSVFLQNDFTQDDTHDQCGSPMMR